MQWFLSEPKLIAIGYAIEQLLDARTRPTFAGRRPADPPDAGICGTLAPAGPGGERKIHSHGRSLMRGKTRPSF